MNFTILSRFNLFFAALLLPLLSLANVDIIKVKAEGVGSSLNEAVDKALVQAISMVNGKSIESETLLKTKSQSKSTNEGSEFSNEKEMQDEIKSRTNGIVDGYKILDQSKTQSGNVKVKLEVKIAKFKLPKSAKRKKIAVIDFIPRQSCCSFKQTDLNGDAVSNVLTDAINNYLVQTRKFTVLDRNYQNLIEEIILDENKKGKTIILTTHDMGQAKRLAKEILFFNKGKLLEQTKATNFFKKPKTNEAQSYINGKILL